MKHSAIAGLFITAALLASPVFASDEDLCASNIQALNDAITTAPATSDGALENAKAALANAQKSQASGDHKACVAETTRMLQKIQNRDPANKG
ncbi:hypothetical protein SAMN04487857_11951 [Pseudomonas sp. ok272]|uniref:hypothetical protein n=1 Tax=unclassified Pseudomonas TaxID=196821 RepID=UPI0008AEF3C0|nr:MULTISPECIES: hypothetical protein [unclassified Pseudomonas]SEN50431.1 hypothetical protein SAMN04487857_11951 [Pseudomonas sp. ok272]SFN29586.1 hypothetical protein SAMN04487858_11815 [Pseudomonas sp. ok602]